MSHLLDRPRPLLMAHRGDAVHAPENTFASFRLALQAGIDLLETDLWITADDVLICHHDRTLDRTTDRSGAIPDLTLQDVKAAHVTGSYCGAYDPASYPGERVPTLDELLDVVPDEVGLALELKDPRLGQPRYAAQLVDQIQARIEARTVLLLSFDAGLLWTARDAAPGVWIGKIGMFSPIPLFRGDGIGTTYPALRLNPLYMWIARLQHLWVCPLDPSPEEHLPRYLRMGVDAVLSHDPAKTREALRRHGI
ncbi:MAG: glycerophosphodiester phosphodiesterase [Anaerolineae bacterium]